MKLGKVVLTTIFIAGMAIGAQALSIGPGDAGWKGNLPKNPKADDIETITGFAGDLTELYKADVVENASPSESGSFAGSYTTVFSNTPNDPADFSITHDGPGTITGANYLLVKDGNNDPVWYVIDISGWNGTDPIMGTGFWPGSGGISHVSIYGGPSNGVPDAGGTLALLGLAIGALGLARRKLS